MWVQAKQARCEHEAQGSEATDNASAKHKAPGSEATDNASAKHGARGSEATKNASAKPEGAKWQSRPIGLAFFAFQSISTQLRHTFFSKIFVSTKRKMCEQDVSSKLEGAKWPRMQAQSLREQSDQL